MNHLSHSFLTNFTLNISSKNLYESLHKISFEAEYYSYYGKLIETKRKSVLQSLYPITYSYAGQIKKSQPLIPDLLLLLNYINTILNLEFNGILINYYPDHSSAMGWHTDKEPEIDSSHPILSISIGTDRMFEFRSLVNKSNREKVLLTDGSAILMPAFSQYYFEHRLCKGKLTSINPHNIKLDRFNLTFRKFLKL